MHKAGIEQLVGTNSILSIGPIFVLFGPGGKDHDERVDRWPNHYKRSELLGPSNLSFHPN